MDTLSRDLLPAVRPRVRVACVAAPQIALQAVLRRWSAEERNRTAVALASGPGERARVVAMTAAAARAGVERGMMVSQARAAAAPRLPAGDGLEVLVSSATDTATAKATLADVAYGFAPRLQAEGERVFFDVGDLQQLYPQGERALAEAIAAQAARLGLAVRVAIASRKSTARAATRVHPIAVVEPTEDARFLAALPVRAGVRDPDDEDEAAALTALARWGVKTLGALAALPVAEVALRLGPAGARLRRVADASDDEALSPTLPPDEVEEGLDLDHEVTEIEPLAFVLRGVLDRTLARLQCRGLACASVTLRLKLAPRGFDLREVPLAAPTREMTPILQLLRLDLARRPPAAAVCGVEVLARPARVRPQQLDFLRPAGPSPERLAATLAQLAGLVGIDNVGAPEEVDTYREEAIRVGPWTAASTAAVDNVQPPPVEEDEPTLGLCMHRFRPPQKLDIIMGREGPVALRGPQLTARVLMAAGPYRVTGEWWRAEGFSRDYWDVQASDGAIYRVHQDRRDGGWYLDGYYD